MPRVIIRVAMPTRRDLLLAPAALLAMRAAAKAANGKMTLAMHQNTSSRAGFRGSLDGWAKAGIKDVEITNNLLDAFLKSETLATARRLIGDLGLTPVSGACGVNGLIEPNPNRATALDSFKRRCEMWAELGLPRIYSTTATTVKPAPDDYKAAADHVREVGQIAAQFKLIAMFEFVRQSTFASTLPTILSITRAAGQPNVGPLFDFYHFWSGHNRLEDMDGLRPGEIKHVHFQDVPGMPREMLDATTRLIPGDGVSPIDAMLGKLAGNGYDGALSVELFLPRFSEGDPFEVAREIRGKCEPVMRRAKVL
jgi:2-keto-myo-inositol isomerase